MARTRTTVYTCAMRGDERPIEKGTTLRDLLPGMAEWDAHRGDVSGLRIIGRPSGILLLYGCTWRRGQWAARTARGLSGRAFLEGIVAGRLPPPPIAALLGFQLVSVGDGEALFRATPDESVYNPLGIVHGGWLCALLDSAAGCAVHTRLPAGVRYSTIEIKVSFLRPDPFLRGSLTNH